MEEVRDLLVEIGTEELPPTALQRLSEAFLEGFRDQLVQHHLEFTCIESFATPRRLALLVHSLAARQPDQETIRKGPALKAAYDADGQPTKAAAGFARSCGVAPQDLQQEETPKGAWLVFRQVHQGQASSDLVVGMTAQALDALPIPKRMRWGDGDDEFVRPVHWVTLLFGNEPVQGRLFGIDAGTSTRGHRFHNPAALQITSASDYAEVLREQGKVEPSFAARRDMIRAQVESLAAPSGGRPVVEADLLDEVTALCEWPSALMGGFDEGFLEVPPEVLIETMQKHQKYFPVVSGTGELLPSFIAISNIQSRDPDQVRAGNERVIRPRFADAAFFWHQDLKQPLDAFVPKLAKVVFQVKLGTLAEKSARVGQISRYIAGLLGFDEDLAARSAELAKCDLLSQMIIEFPSLQGTMGRYYAEKAGEDPCVVAAMEQQYLPRHAGDQLPRSRCGQVLSIAEKLDTLVGIFAIGQRPTGVKDPYALRRATIGLLRILIETPLALDLREVLDFTAEELRDKVDAKTAAAEVFDYSMERLKGYYQDRGIGVDVIDSVLAVHPRVPSDIHRRVLAVESFRLLPEAEALTAANKRIRNILRKSSETAPGEVDGSVLQEEAERRLAARIPELQAAIVPLLQQQDYEGVLKTLSRLRTDVDEFFDQVMVMAEDSELRLNRLALLRFIESLFLRVADISRLK
jgi:glycyl-tRNA synthetase beta chain